MKRPRLRKWAKWACTLAAGAAVTLAVFSVLCACSIVHTSSGRGMFWSVAAHDGLVSFTKVEGLTLFMEEIVQEIQARA